MIAQSNSWRDIQTLDAKKKNIAETPATGKPAPANQPLVINQPRAVSGGHFNLALIRAAINFAKPLFGG